MGWTTVSLADVCSVRSSLIDPTDPIFRDLPHVAPDSIERNSGRLLTFRTAAQDGVTSGKYRFEAGDLLYSKIRPNLNKATLVGFHGICSADMYALKIDTLQIDPAFLGYVIRGNDFLKYATSYSNRANIPKLNRSQLEGFRFELPPLDEQRRIAAILGRADGLRVKRREAGAHLDALAQAIFLEMFDGFGKDVRWPTWRLVDLCESSDDIRCGPFGTQLAKSEFKEAGVPLWGIKNVNREFKLPAWEFLDNDTAARLRNYSLEPGDIVMTRKGTIGNCCVYPAHFPNGIMHSDLLRLRVNADRCSPDFLAHLLHHDREVERQIGLISGGAVMPGINVSRLKGIEIRLPPKRLQDTFVARSRASSSTRDLLESQLVELDALFASLQKRAFSGQL